MRQLASPFQIHASAFGPADPVAIEQLFNSGIRGGEERLMLAVLQDAVECFQEHVLARYLWERKLFQEAEDWILAKNTNWLFSFENICETLQLSPDYIRRGLQVWKEAKRKSHSVARARHRNSPVSTNARFMDERPARNHQHRAYSRLHRA
jgi:hypothetical protein